MHLDRFSTCWFFLLNHWLYFSNRIKFHVNNHLANNIWILLCFNRFGLIFLIFEKSEAATRGVLRNFAKFTGKHLCQSLFFFIKKESLAQVFSCEFCEISTNTFFIEHLRTTASKKWPNIFKYSIFYFFVLSIKCITVFNTFYCKSSFSGVISFSI